MSGQNEMHPIADRCGRIRNFDFCSEEEPTEPWPYMLWIQPSTGSIRIRNQENTDWITLGIGGDLPTMTHVQATTAAGQSIPTSAWTTIIFDTEVYDTPGEYDPVTGVFTAAVAGYYHVHSSISFTATTTWAATEYAILSAWVDGVEKLRLDRAYDHTNANIQVYMAGGASFYLAAGQTLAIRVYQASGDALALYPSATWNWLTIDRLR